MTTNPRQWLVNIDSPDDGRSNHVVGPFETEDEACAWRVRFCKAYSFDQDFIQVVQHVTWDPKNDADMAEIKEWYGEHVPVTDTAGEFIEKEKDLDARWELEGLGDHPDYGCAE
jgi:hypothetical protein